MAFQNPASAPGARLLNTLRFVGKEVDGERIRMDRRTFAKKVIFDFLELTAKEIYCYQDFQGRSTFDVTFTGEYICSKAWDKCKENNFSDPIQDFCIEPFFARETRILTVHMYNPYCKENDIVSFLKRYCEVIGIGIKSKDEDELWNGKRQYVVRLKPSPTGGIVHPPATFFIGANKGYLYYAGQPLTCRKCGQKGHMAERCENIFCRNCMTAGHMAKDCNVPKACNLCGSREHMFKECPQRQKKYSDALRDIEEVIAEILTEDVVGAGAGAGASLGPVREALPVASEAEPQVTVAGGGSVGTPAVVEAVVAEQEDAEGMDSSAEGTVIPDTVEERKKGEWKMAKKKSKKRRSEEEGGDTGVKMAVIEISNQFGCLQGGGEESEVISESDSELASVPVLPSEEKDSVKEMTEQTTEQMESSKEEEESHIERDSKSDTTSDTDSQGSGFFLEKKEVDRVTKIMGM